MAASGTLTLCRGLADLAQATTRDALEAAGRLVIDGWNEALPLCEAKDPACGPHVAEAVAAASRGFQAAGKPSKSIAAAKIVLGRPDVPGVSMVAPALTLEIGDRYHALGIFDRAAEYYARYVRLKAPAPGLAADRALSLFVALRNVDAATRLAGELAMDNQYPDARRAGWLLLVAGLVRAVKGPAEAAAWLDPHRALLAAAGEPGAIAEIAKPLPDKPATTTESCPSLLACAIRRLAGEARWSPSAGRIPPLDRSHLKP